MNRTITWIGWIICINFKGLVIFSSVRKIVEFFTWFLPRSFYNLPHKIVVGLNRSLAANG